MAFARGVRYGARSTLFNFCYEKEKFILRVVNINCNLVESGQVSWPTERRNFSKKDGSFGLESEMSSKRRQREPKATMILVQISPSEWLMATSGAYCLFVWNNIGKQ